MKSASVASVRARFADYLEESRGEPVIVMRQGEPVAVLLGLSSRAEAKRLRRQSPRKLADVLTAARRRIEQGKGLSHEEFWKLVRARHRRKKELEKD